MRQTLSKGVFAAAAATGILSLYGAPAFADAHAEGAATDSPGALSGNSVQAPVEVPVNVCGNTVGVVSAFNEASDNLCANTSHASEPTSATKAEDKSGSLSSAERSYDGHGGGAHAEGVAKGSPGVASGNLVQAPVHAPVNVCGNNVDVIGAFNEASDNDCRTTSHGGSGGGGAQAEGVATDSPGVASGNLIQVPLGLPLNVCGNNVNLVGLFNEASDNDCRTEQSQVPETETETETPSTPPTSTDTPPPAQVVDTPPQDVEEPGAPPHLAETGSEGMLAASAAGATLLVGGALLYRRSRAALRG
ncbi:chaplin family protein [Streptomyces sp. GDS52]|uniref:Chaplin family protein n=1 Tax=Streptomyces cathayae TaxID=3031124 RepID=A0ABY8K3Q3_9ACTN|nr:chaplin family protein [Streptomyces sp. HUAS 5]WGD42904.1 chaplin family protein [Streptomyces sp. HUAS 5]